MVTENSNTKKILIVEDNKDMHEIYRSYFNDYRNEYNVDMEDKADEALSTLQRKKYDLIILDMIMEPLAGDSFFVYVKADERTREIPILVVTVLNPETLQRLNKIGDLEFLQKPITEEQLMKKIGNMIG